MGSVRFSVFSPLLNIFLMLQYLFSDLDLLGIYQMLTAYSSGSKGVWKVGGSSFNGAHNIFMI